MSDPGHALFAGCSATLSAFGTYAPVANDQGVPHKSNRKPPTVMAVGALQITAPLGREISYLQIGDVRQPLLRRRRIWRVDDHTLIWPQPVPQKYWQLDVEASLGANAYLDRVLSQLCRFEVLEGAYQAEIDDIPMFDSTPGEETPSALVLDAIKTIKLRSVPISRAASDMKQREYLATEFQRQWEDLDVRAAQRPASEPSRSFSRRSPQQVKSAPATLVRHGTPEIDANASASPRTPSTVPSSPQPDTEPELDTEAFLLSPMHDRELLLTSALEPSPVKNKQPRARLSDFGPPSLGRSDQEEEPTDEYAQALSTPTLTGVSDESAPTTSKESYEVITTPKASSGSPSEKFSILSSPRIINQSDMLERSPLILGSKAFESPNHNLSVSSSSTLDDTLELFSPDLDDTPLDGPFSPEPLKRSMFGPMDREIVRFHHPLIPAPLQSIYYRAPSPRTPQAATLHHEVTTVGGFVSWHLMNRILPLRK